MVSSWSLNSIHWRMASLDLCFQLWNVVGWEIHHRFVGDTLKYNLLIVPSKGFAGGAFVLAAPAYSSEIAETRYRGILGTMMQLMVCLGILFINLNCNTDWKGLP